MAGLWKLLALVAVLLMPLGMQPAAAAPVEHHQIDSVTMPADHCPDEGSAPQEKGNYAVCTLICSAALPAADLPEAQFPMIACVPVQGAAARSLNGLHPETATPPPKRS